MSSERLTDSQWRWLADLIDGKDPLDRLSSRSEFGGAAGTRSALVRRGLITGNGFITDKGRTVMHQDRETRR